MSSLCPINNPKMKQKTDVYKIYIILHIIFIRATSASTAFGRDASAGCDGQALQKNAVLHDHRNTGTSCFVLLYFCIITI